MARFRKPLKPCFADLVIAGTKDHTVRPMPKRIPKVGDTVTFYVWTGKAYRSPQRTVKTVTLTQVEPVIIGPGVLEIGTVGVVDPAVFAMRDGFCSWEDLRAWFTREHGEGRFSGLLLNWGEVYR